jgi:Fic family protein
VKRIDPAPIQSYTDLYRSLFRTKYAVTQYNVVQFLADHLADLSRVFDPDLQAVVVLALVGQMELQARIRSNFSGGGEMPDSDRVGAPPRINASSIAAVRGIPRETVRRKLDDLGRRGWIARDKKGRHIKTSGPEMAPVRRELIDLDHRQIERVSRFLGVMHALAVEEQRGAE